MTQEDVDKMILELDGSGAGPEKQPQFNTPDSPPPTSPIDKPIDTPAAEQVSQKLEWTADKAKATANTWVKWFNSFMKLSFPWFYKKTILEKGDEKKMADFVRLHRGKTEKEMQDIISNDDNLWPVQNRFDRYLKAMEAAPLSSEEMEFIAEPLSELIIKYRWMQLGPEWSLVIAVLLIMLPRLEPVIPGLKKAFSSDEAKTDE